MSWAITENTVCLVTGASAGIGKETARGLAALGATVVIAGRHAARTERVARELRQSTSNPRVSHLIADFSSLDEVVRLAAEMTDRHAKLHILINNAGVWHQQRRDSHDGFDDTFAVNHLAPFLLTSLLRHRLIESAPARVITVSSTLHKLSHRIRFHDLDHRRRLGWFGLAPYAHSKLANVLFSLELARRLEGTGVTSNCLHPGNVATTVVRDSRLLSVGIQVGRLFLLTPTEGARTSLHLATAPELDGVTGGYFASCQQQQPSSAGQDTETASRLWRVSQALCRLDDRDVRRPEASTSDPKDRYEVTIRYREGVFASYAGLPVRTYSGVFHVQGADEVEACDQARAEFEHLRRVSSVAWPRDIVEVVCRRLD